MFSLATRQKWLMKRVFMGANRWFANRFLEPASMQEIETTLTKERIPLLLYFVAEYCRLRFVFFGRMYFKKSIGGARIVMTCMLC